MRVLILGSGGREHALAWLINKSPKLTSLFCMPGNPGTSQIAENLSGDVKDFNRIKEVVVSNNIDMVLVGPEDPLVLGLQDFFSSDEELKRVLFIGPSKNGAKLEGSKDFAKEFMVRHHIPTAKYGTFTAQTIDQAYKFLESLNPPYVLKADGLAAGKGVLILTKISEAISALKEMFAGKFGESGKRVIIEEYLDGIEVSVFILTDGSSYLILPEAKDYKRVSDGDQGLNTGGMGAVSPVPFFDAAFKAKVEDRIIKPTIEGLKCEEIDYRGFIFIGLMNCNGEPYVIEYNVRMGDPETESVVRRVESDFLSHLTATAEGRLENEKIKITADISMAVIAVSEGYPESYKSGYEIEGLHDLTQTLLFHAGTAFKDGKVITKGGRVIALTTLADSIPDAQEKIYREILNIRYENIFYRKDIGSDLLENEK